MRSRPLASRTVLGADVAVLTADHPEQADGGRELAQRCDAARVGAVLAIADEREGVVEQCVTRQHRDVLAVADVRRRATAAQCVVVERRQIVVDE